MVDNKALLLLKAAEGAILTIFSSLFAAFQSLWRLVLLILPASGKKNDPDATLVQAPAPIQESRQSTVEAASEPTIAEVKSACNLLPCQTVSQFAPSVRLKIDRLAKPNVSVFLEFTITGLFFAAGSACRPGSSTKRKHSSRRTVLCLRFRCWPISAGDVSWYVQSHVQGHDAFGMSTKKCSNSARGKTALLLSS